MRTRQLQFLFIFVSFLSSIRGFGFLNSQSNYHIGVIICPDKIELLDTYEARILRELVTPANINFETLLAIINKSMPDRADLYRNTSRDFQNLIRFRSPARTFLFRNWSYEFQTITFLGSDSRQDCTAL